METGVIETDAIGTVGSCFNDIKAVLGCENEIKKNCSYNCGFNNFDNSVFPSRKR